MPSRVGSISKETQEIVPGFFCSRNTIESWNAANAFVFYGKGGEISTNRIEEQKISEYE